MSEAIQTESTTRAGRFSLAGRSGWQLLVSYGIGSWIVLQVAEVLSSLIGLPLWFGRSLLALLLTGLLLLVLSMTIQAGRAVLPAQSANARRSPFGWLTVRNIAFAGLGTTALLVLGTAVYLTLRSSGIGPFGTLMSKGVLGKQERLILADFESRTADPELGPTVTTLFRIDLAQSPSFSVLEPSQLRAVLHRMVHDPAEPVDTEVALEAARREGIKAIVTGEVLPVGEAVVVAVRLVAVSSRETLAAVRETAASPTDLPKVVDRASARLRERIGESLRSIQGDPPLERVTTRSLPALEKYAQAEQANNAGEQDRALKLLEQAIADDSTFAMAHRKLAIILRNQGREEERARLALTRAWELRKNLSEREQWLAEAAYLTYVENDGPAAASVYRTILEKYPSDAIALNNLAVAYMQTDRPMDALALFRRSIDAGGAPAVTFSNVIEVQFRLGEVAESDSLLGLFREAFPDNPQADRIAAWIASAQFDYDAAETYLRRFSDSPAVDPGVQVGSLAELAMVLGIRGRIEESRQALRDAAIADQKAGTHYLGLSPDIVTARIDAPVALYHLGDAAGAVRIADEAFTPARVEMIPPEMRPYADLVGFYADAGRIDRAKEWLLRFEAARPAEQRDNGFDWHFALGSLALAEHRHDDALREFTTAHELADDCDICFLFEIGRAYDEAGKADSAVATYTRYLEARDLTRVNSDAWNLWRVLLRLATLYEQAGRPRDAITCYARFLDLWSDADVILARHIEDARRSMNRLNQVIG